MPETKREPTKEEMRAYLHARPYVKCSRGGWVEVYIDGLGMRWTFYPRDGRHRPSDDYTLEMAYGAAVQGRFGGAEVVADPSPPLRPATDETPER